MKPTGWFLLYVVIMLPAMALGAKTPSILETPAEDVSQPALPPMPLTLSIEGRDFPAWVDEREVLLPSGKVNPAFFHPLIQEQIEAYLKLPPKAGRIRLSQIDEEIVNAPVRSDLKTAVETSAMVLLGRVTGVSQGFRGGTPGSLLRIDSTRVFKGSANQDEYFVFIPVGEVRLQSVVLSKSDPRYPALPAAGDEVVLLVAPDWRNTGSFLWLSDDASLVTIKNESGVSLPQRFLKTNSGLVGARRELIEKLVEDLEHRGRDK